MKAELKKHGYQLAFAVGGFLGVIACRYESMIFNFIVFTAGLILCKYCDNEASNP